MRLFRTVPVAALLFLLLSARAHAQPAAETPAVACPSCSFEGTRAFADQLFADGDYFRAIGEYKRLAWFAKTPTEQSYPVLRVGQSLLKAGRPAEAAGWLRESGSTLGDETGRARARWLEARAWYEAGRLDDARMASTALAGDAVLGSAARRMGALVAVAEDDAGEALRLAGDDPVAVSGGFPLLLEERVPPRAPSPVVAGLLAAVVPGSGHLYAGSPGDAVYTFLLNAAFFGGTWYLASRGSTGGAIAVGSIGALFYGGNIYGSVNAAKRAEERWRTETVERADRALFPRSIGASFDVPLPW